jgi:uncharacterized membrane protein HdeD (DUF308 family)/predicted flap endonuclease-1-like 5' DNA nuclease
MGSASTASSRESFTPWWLVLIEGILAIIVGFYLLTTPFRTFFYLIQVLGIYWLITGAFTIALIFFNRAMWGWKLFTGLLGIAAGAIVLQYPLGAAITLAPLFVYIVAFLGIIYGIIFLFQAFRGAGWGVGILGALSIVFGLILLGNTLVAAVSLPWVLGVLAILFGFLAIVMAFVVRSREKKEAELLRRRQAATVMPPRPAPPSTPPAPVAPAVVKDVAGAGSGVGSAGMAAAAGAVAAGAVASKAAAEEPAEVGTPVEAAAPAEAAPMMAAAMAEEPPAAEPPADMAQVEKNVEASVDRDNPEEMAKFSYPLEYVEGIGPAYAGKLKEIGIVTPLDLLKSGAFPKGRAEIAEKSGISGKLVLEWVNHCDLYRIKGVGSEWADLLEEAGVDTVVELAMRNPTNLFDKMNQVNEEKKLVRKTPTQAQVEDWVGQAKNLPRVVNY